MASVQQLEQHINNYIAEIGSKGSLTAEDIKELRAHLADTADGLMLLGLTSDEAFAVAKLRLGQQDEIAAEFKKVNGSSMLNKEWIFIFIGIAAAIIIQNILSFMEIWLAYNTVSGDLSAGTAALLLSFSYTSIIILTIYLFKKGEHLSWFLREKVLGKNKFLISLFAGVVGFICLMPISRLLNINPKYFQSTMQAVSDITRENRVTELIIRGTIPAVVIISLVLSSHALNKKPGWHTFFKSSNYLYIFLAGVGLETVAALGRMFILPAFGGPLFLGIVTATGTAAFFYHNRLQKNTWGKTLCFVAFSFIAELIASIARTENGNWTDSVLFWYFIASCAGIVTGLLISRILFAQRK